LNVIGAIISGPQRENLRIVLVVKVHTGIRKELGKEKR